MTIELLPMAFSVCKLNDASEADLTARFTFFARTDKEISLVCPAAHAPAHPLAAETGWRCLRFPFPLDFSLVGILARIAGILAREEISIFAVSTFDTDYILLKENQLKKALAALRRQGYDLLEDTKETIS